MINPSPDEIRSTLGQRLFGLRVGQNNLRGELAEEIVRCAIEPEWSHCGGDCNAWDFEHRSEQIRVQVKQSARLQSWQSLQSTKISGGKFAIPPQSGYYVEDKWTALRIPRRLSQIYIFCWHPIAERSKADHFDVDQWEFFVALEKCLGAGKKVISWNELQAWSLDREVWSTKFSELLRTLNDAASKVEPSTPSGGFAGPQVV